MSRAAQGYSMYKNSEELQQLIVARHALPVRELHRVFDTVDFYHWGEDDAGRRGCVPEYYAGVQRDNTAICACFQAPVCNEVRARLCKRNFLQTGRGRIDGVVFRREL